MLLDFWRLMLRALQSMLERATYAEALFAEKERAQIILNFIGDARPGDLSQCSR